MAMRFPSRGRTPIGRPILGRPRAPIGREGGRGPVQVRPGGGNPPIRLRPKPPAPGPVRLRPGGGSGNPPIAIRPIPPRPGGGFPGRPVRPPIDTGYPQPRPPIGGYPGGGGGILDGGGGGYPVRPPGIGYPHPPIMPIGPEPVRGGPTRITPPWGDGPMPVRGPGYGPPGGYPPAMPLSRFNNALDMSKFLTQTAFAAQHPVDQALPPDHGLHPAQVQLLKDHYDANLLSNVAAQAGGGGGMGIMY